MSGRPMSPWWTVFVKEVRENLRDRRAVGTALLYGPLFGPLLFALMATFIVGKRTEAAERPLSIAVIGSERAPNLLGFLRQRGVVIRAAPQDPEAAIRDQQEEVVLCIPADYQARWLSGEPARVELLLDSSRQAAQLTVSRLEQLLDAYAQQTSKLRLLMRGLDPQLATPLSIARSDQSTARSRGANFLALLPYFLLLCAFLGGMYLAIDSTAGERERQSLEPLMITPVAPAQIMAGKLAATTVFAVASVITCIVAFHFAVQMIPTADLGFELNLTAKVAVQMLVLLVPVALFAAAVQTVISSFARSFREAQTYLQFLMIIPAIPSVVLVVSPVKPVLWMLLTPLLSQSLLINELARGDQPSLADLMACVIGTVIAALLVSALAIRLYGREQLALST